MEGQGGATKLAVATKKKNKNLKPRTHFSISLSPTMILKKKGLDNREISIRSDLAAPPEYTVFSISLHSPSPLPFPFPPASSWVVVDISFKKKKKKKKQGGYSNLSTSFVSRT